MHLGKDAVHGRSGSGHPLSDSLQARLLCVFVYVCVRVFPCLLCNAVQISSACVRIAKGEKGYFINLVTGSSALQWYILVFFLDFMLLTLSKIFASTTNNESLLCTLGWWFCLDLVFYVANTADLSEKLCLEGDGKQSIGADRGGKVFPNVWDFSFC